MIATTDPFRFSDKHADDAVSFFHDVVKHVKGRHAHLPFILEKWQEKIIRDLFGWRRADGTRRYRVAYVECGRKNGKSTMGAAIALKLLLEDFGGEVYSCASTREQASVVFDIAAGMVRESRELTEILKVYPAAKRIVYPNKNAVYKALAADAGPLHGLSPSGIIFDELHAQPNRSLWDVMRSGTGSREQPLTVALTTAGHDRQSICWELHQYAVGVLEGRIDDPAFYPVIYAADVSDDWTDEAVWEQANPCLDVSLKREYLREEFARARDNPAYENTFRNLHLSQWTEQAVRWMPMGAWDKCTETISDEDLLGRECWAGLDLAATRDLCSLVLCFPLDGGRYAFKPWFWAPRESATLRQRQDKMSYFGFASQGKITLTDGNVMDDVAICETIDECARLYDVRNLLFDPHNAHPVVQPLMREYGWPLDKMREFPQRVITYNDPMKQLLSLVLEGKLIHNRHPVLRWNFANLVVKPDPNGDMKPDKGKSGDKIDGACAALMAFAGSLAGEGKSVYETRGVLTL